MTPGADFSTRFLRNSTVTRSDDKLASAIAAATTVNTMSVKNRARRNENSSDCGLMAVFSPPRSTPTNRTSINCIAATERYASLATSQSFDGFA